MRVPRDLNKPWAVLNQHQWAKRLKHVAGLGEGDLEAGEAPETVSRQKAA